MKYDPENRMSTFRYNKNKFCLRMSKILQAVSSAHARQVINKNRLKNAFKKKPAPPYKFVLPIGKNLLN